MSNDSTRVQRLKDEGNALHSAKKFSAAVAKYSEALKIDGSNALIFANRAACLLAMKQYLDALSDAQRATELDPTYSKAWARSAAAYEALGMRAGSQAMWKKALECLPLEEHMTPMDKRLKEQYEAGLETANVALGRGVELAEGLRQMKTDTGDLPWQVAAMMVEELKRNNDLESSAWKIHLANEDFTNGVQYLKALKKKDTENGQMYFGRLGTIDEITNAILRDTRVFRIPEEDFLVRLMDQLQFEKIQNNSWSETHGMDSIKREAMERLRTQSYVDVRRALTLTVRACIMIGFLSIVINPSYTASIEHLQRALDIINWGREQFKDVPQKDRGVIYSHTFRRCVWNMLLDSMLAAFSEGERPGLEQLESIKKLAEGLVRDVEDNPPVLDETEGPMDPGARWSFFDNIRGNALACIGFYHVQVSDMNNTQAGPNQVSKKKHMLAASECYYKAAFCYPEDDDNHPWYLNCAFQYIAPIGAPTTLIMEILERIRLSVPKVNRLWYRQPGSAKSNRVKTYEHLAKIEERAKQLIADGKMKMDVGPFDFKAATNDLK
ncbi:TPR-like protein [Dendrothele bispora CBS 962.96]|uniref:TPR-like protein n=1 Tax=Dendrothele bispora (strain CBS 962.96) TaxID=1314807 RepID=A0A4S8M7U9_DENBC|nr:TPR-like protein [Dendrothele bispora CBS 962.96]